MIMNTNELLTLSTGNKKLVPNNETKFLIWSLPAEKTCPFATELCKKYCYAKKAERMYKATREARERNLMASQQDSFIFDMAITIQFYLDKKTWKDKQVIFRIHESGDFYNAEYVRKWVIIARMFPEVTFIAYTKSLAYFTNELIPSNMVIRASIWSDTPQNDLDCISSNNMATYTALDKTALESFTGGLCKCSDCATCQMCFNSTIKNIACKIH